MKRLRLVISAALVLGCALFAIFAPQRGARAAAVSAGPAGPASPASSVRAVAAPRLVLVPYATTGIRALAPIEGKLLIYADIPDTETLQLVGLRAIGPFGVLDERPLGGLTLRGDPAFGEVQALLERLPAHLTHRSTSQRYFAPPAAPAIDGADVVGAWNEARARSQPLIDRYQADLSAGRPLPFAEPAFALELDQLFAPEDGVGSEREVRLEVEWIDAAGVARTQSTLLGFERLASFPSGESLALSIPGFEIHRGDLHVHSCYGEPVLPCSVFAGLCPSESAQVLTASFSYAQLKAGYAAAGMDWFTATDHSYCVSTPATYTAIVTDCLTNTSASFIVLPDIEVSSLEQGTQSGTDPFGDVACAFLANANHMGAHGVTSMKVGGLPAPAIPPGFCLLLNGFLPNAAAVRAEGGWPVMNHPTDGFEWAWNSFASTAGIEGWQMHGTEIWATETSFANHLLAWVEHLKAGRILYAYGGSDTHDAAPSSFGINHALVSGGFSSANLSLALRAGRVFVSNGPCAVLEVVQGGQTMLMGAIRGVAIGGAVQPVTINVHYDFSTTPSGSGTVSVWRGTVGGSEGLIAVSTKTGAGTYSVADNLPLDVQCWYRAEGSSNQGALNVYTNPVFFVPTGGPCWPVLYGQGAGGANIGTLTGLFPAKLGGALLAEISGLSDLPTVGAVLGISTTTLGPAGVPFLGGTLLIGLDASTTLLSLPLANGSATLFLGQIPADPLLVGATFYAQAGSVHTALPQLISFSNGVQVTICP